MRIADRRLTRRNALLGAGALASTVLMGSKPAPGQAAKYPSRKISVIVPTGQGGGAERLARAFDAVWSKSLGQPFEYEFHAGAAGQVGYTLYVQKRPRDGHNLLFGNMGPEMIMYALQKPAYKFPDDYIYFCRTDIDDSCIFVRTESPFKRVEDVIAEAKKRTLNVATSRIPHPASIGILALGKATNAKFNLIPYGGGNPTQIAVLSGEVDCGVLPAAGIVRLVGKLRILAIFNSKQNVLAKHTDNAPLVNDVFGTKLPDLYSSRSWAIHSEFADKNPDAMKILEDSSKKVFDDPAFVEAAKKVGEAVEALQYGDRKVCTEYALSMIALAKEYESVLSAKEPKKT
ncbi:MAG: Bug family tripartite tricarboxylate transporter substrate binding protein [Hyphomicrobiaceae bacterium]